ncbi:MAG: ABC transporter permease [Pirellulales bacterium]|nr:ABC transporter permease [Pirellulales bacterium]
MSTAGHVSHRVASSSAQPAPWLAAGTLCWRELVRFVRQPNRVAAAIGQPALFWILFGAGFGPTFAMPGAEGLTYREFFFPGTLVLVVLFTSIFTSISLIEDRREGFLQGVLVAPVPRWALVTGKVAGGALLALLQALVLVPAGWMFGLRLDAATVASLALMLLLLSVALTAMGFAFAWRLDSSQGFHAVMSLLLFPLWMLSGAFFAAQSGPLAWFQRVNPLSYGVAGVRRLLTTGMPEGSLPPGLPSSVTCWLVTGAFAAIMMVVAVRLARRATRGDLL